MSSIRGHRWCRYSTEKCLPDSHLPFVYSAILSTSPLITIWGCVSSAYPILLWWSRECVLYLIIIIKPEVWIINHCLGLGHETMVCAVCLTMFLKRTGETNQQSIYPNFQILFWIVMPTFGKSCHRSWLHGLKKTKLSWILGQIFQDGCSPACTRILGGKYNGKFDSFWQWKHVQYFLIKFTIWCWNLKACW